MRRDSVIWQIQPVAQAQRVVHRVSPVRTTCGAARALLAQGGCLLVHMMGLGCAHVGACVCHCWGLGADVAPCCPACLPVAQVGGGDQLYCDPVFELPTVKQWLSVDDPHVSQVLRQCCSSSPAWHSARPAHGWGSHMVAPAGQRWEQLVGPVSALVLRSCCWDQDWQAAAVGHAQTRASMVSVACC